MLSSAAAASPAHPSVNGHATASATLPTPTFSSSSNGAAGVAAGVSTSSSTSAAAGSASSSASSASSASAAPHRFVRSILVLGASMVGKSSLCQRFVQDRYDEAYEPTYENRFVKMINFKHHEIELVIKDTQGLSEQELFRSEYGLGYHGYMLVYSISSLRSFESVRSINQKLTTLLGTSNVPRVLVGAKQDTAFEGVRQVSADMGAELAHQMGCSFVECSARANHNVDKAFLTLLEEVDRASEVETTRTMWLADCFRCLQPDGDFALNDDSVWDRAAHMGIVCVLLLSVASLAVGASVGFLAATDNAEKLAYILFAFGVLLSLLSLIGMFGIRHSSVDYLYVYAVSLGALVGAQIATFFVLLFLTTLLAPFVIPIVIAVCVTICLEGAAASVVYFYQYVLRQSMHNSYFTSTHYQSLLG